MATRLCRTVYWNWSSFIKNRSLVIDDSNQLFGSNARKLDNQGLSALILYTSIASSKLSLYIYAVSFQHMYDLGSCLYSTLCSSKAMFVYFLPHSDAVLLSIYKNPLVGLSMLTSAILSFGVTFRCQILQFLFHPYTELAFIY